MLTACLGSAENQVLVIDMSDLDDTSDIEGDSNDENGDRDAVGGKDTFFSGFGATLSRESQAVGPDKRPPVRWKFRSNGLVQVLMILIHQSESLTPTR